MTDDVQEFYNRWTNSYDSFSTLSFIDNWRKDAITDLNLNIGDTVIDIGSATGANVPHLLEDVEDTGSVICLDISKQPLQSIMEKYQTNKRVSTVRADATNLPVQSVDALFASFSIGMFDNPRKAVEDWCSELDSGTKVGLMNVVKTESLIDYPIQIFTGLGVPTNIKNKIRLSVSGEALDQLNGKIRDAYSYLEENHTLLSKERRFGGSIMWICVEIQPNIY